MIPVNSATVSSNTARSGLDFISTARRSMLIMCQPGCVPTVESSTSVQPVPEDLLALVKQTAPPEADVVPLLWAYEDEDYNIAIVMPDTVDRLEAREIEDRLIDVVMDYDAAHGTYPLCMVWREREKVHAGVQ